MEKGVGNCWLYGFRDIFKCFIGKLGLKVLKLVLIILWISLRNIILFILLMIKNGIM